jgi:pimeloyl-ACP methyl ester carboxylesterase
MPFFEDGDVRIHYQESGEGFPVLLIAPGGMRSEMSYWEGTPWNPITHLSPHYRMIAMDQRNAGQSTAPVSTDDTWETYTRDQLALMDHLGIDRFHVAGMCIGGPYIMGLIDAAPERVASGVVFQTIGLDGNVPAFHDMFDDWAQVLKPQRPEVPAEAWDSFRANMYDTGQVLFNVDEAWIEQCQTPLLVLLGNDLYHPESSSRTLHRLASNSTLVENWKEPEHHATAMAAVEEFLSAHTAL